MVGITSNEDEEENISVSVTPYSNLPSPVVPVLTPPKQEPFPSKDLFIKDPDSQDVLEEESEVPVGGLSAEEIESSKPKVRDTSDLIEGVETSVSVEKSIHDKLEQERIALLRTCLDGNTQVSTSRNIDYCFRVSSSYCRRRRRVKMKIIFGK